MLAASFMKHFNFFNINNRAMKNFLFISAFLIISFISNAQTLICWRSDVVKYNPSSGEFEAFAKTDMNSEAFFNDTYIRVNDDKLYLTKVRTTSRTKTKDGTITIYDVTKSEGGYLIATVVEDRNGIFKMLLTKDEKAEYGVVYYFKSR